MIRSAQDVLDVAKARGFTVHIDVGPPIMPFLRGDVREATGPLMAALKCFRLEVIELLRARDGCQGIYSEMAARGGGVGAGRGHYTAERNGPISIPSPDTSQDRE